MEILVDSNVLLDIVTRGVWFLWSSQKIAYHAERDTLLVNPVIYAEISIGFDSVGQLEERLSSDAFRRANLPWEAAFLAGRAFQQYRKRGGTRASTLPDFFIGAHASVIGATLLTRDAARYRAYFPRLRLITPA